MKQKDFTSSPRRWPRRIRTVVLLLLCLALLLGGLLLPRELCRWIERQQFDRVVQLDGTSTGADPLNFSQRLELLTVSNTLLYDLSSDTTQNDSADGDNTEATLSQTQNCVQTRATAMDAVTRGIKSLNEYTGFPYFDTDLTLWAQTISGFDPQQGKMPPSTSLLLNRQTGQGAVFWYVNLFPEDNGWGLMTALDDETGLMMQYYYYNPNLDFLIYQGFVNDLASGLSKYWGLEVLDLQEMVNDSYGSVNPGWIQFSDGNGGSIQIVVDAGSDYLSINQVSMADVVWEYENSVQQSFWE